jgi:GH24 family phage-related lysozyme (muramidase)
MSDSKLLFTNIMRDSIHNLDLTNSANEEIFRKYTREIIIMVEGVRDKAYRDTKGNMTIGVGFNMEGARNEWDTIFDNQVSFDDAYKGKIKLTDVQINRLLDYQSKRD